jgi:quinol monooxygenase YgiN
MVNVGLWVRVRARPGREKDLAEFLTSARAVVEEEPDTVAWFAVQLDESTFAIFGAFPDDAARRAHLVGGVGKALADKGPELLREPPSIEYADVLASKLPNT